MPCLVTGAAGFIGSHLCEYLLANGYDVIGLDCFTDYYSRDRKQQNLNSFRHHPRFRFLDLDLTTDNLSPVLDSVDTVYHLAGMPGLNRSWTGFDEYVRHNITGTHRLLEAAKGNGVRRFVFASTSSVYGRFASGDESMSTQPCSPYGITKLAGEQLAKVYHEVYGVPVITLRYFSVYGPRQRPDMGYHLFIERLLRRQPIPLTGDGSQVRGNTFVADCVEATAMAGQRGVPGEVYNVGGGELTTIIDVIRRLELITGLTAQIEYRPSRMGDQLATGADVSKLSRHLGWKPLTGLDEGLSEQVRWQAQMMGIPLPVETMVSIGRQSLVPRSVMPTLALPR